MPTTRGQWVLTNHTHTPHMICEGDQTYCGRMIKRYKLPMEGWKPEEHWDELCTCCREWYKNMQPKVTTTHHSEPHVTA